MNNLIKTIRYSLLITAIIFSTARCKDSYLELKDPNSISEANFPTTLNQVNLLIASVYGVQHHWGFYGQNWLGYGIYCLDHTIDLQWRGDDSWIGICTGLAQSTDTKLQNQWKALNRGIYYANSALEGINKYRAIAPSSEKEEIDHYEGEAIFLRGFYLWHLLSFYGQPNLDGMGVPVITTVPKSIEEMSVPRASTKDTYQAIINDFKKAASLLKGQTDNHRATEWSAKAALAKTYLFADKKDSAKIYLEDCINNSGKSLVSFNAYKMMFNGNKQYEYNSESFYEIGNLADPVNGNSYGSPMTGTTTSMLYAQFYIAADGSRSATSYSNEYMHDRNLTRFGYNDAPPLTQLETNGTNWNLKQSYIDQQKERREQAGKQVDGPDPRLWVCALQPFFDSVKVSNVYYKVAQAEFGKWYEMAPATLNNPNTFYGWPTRKYQYLDGKLIETRNVAGYNFYFIRLPDIYLMYAEILKSSNPTLALEYINKVHRRAYGYDPNTPSPVDYVSLTDRTKAPVDDHLANDPLLYERWAEFFGEARWWEDVRRLKMGPQEATFYKEVAGGKGKITWRNEHYAMPIPSIEFESNTDPGMKQNPGY
ncbi:MAG: RagB/SusD family nutrient uptake outer membrane protein [Bacteroidetes bacterium]|nr:RagB/SusD family nutrient uptake outer membrane protein [Bacteroidota bacterium]